MKYCLTIFKIDTVQGLEYINLINVEFRLNIISILLIVIFKFILFKSSIKKIPICQGQKNSPFSFSGLPQMNLINRINLVRELFNFYYWIQLFENNKLIYHFLLLRLEWLSIRVFVKSTIKNLLLITYWIKYSYVWIHTQKLLFFSFSNLANHNISANNCKNTNN